MPALEDARLWSLVWQIKNESKTSFGTVYYTKMSSEKTHHYNILQVTITKVLLFSGSKNYS